MYFNMQDSNLVDIILIQHLLHSIYSYYKSPDFVLITALLLKKLRDLSEMAKGQKSHRVVLLYYIGKSSLYFPRKKSGLISSGKSRKGRVDVGVKISGYPNFFRGKYNEHFLHI